MVARVGCDGCEDRNIGCEAGVSRLRCLRRSVAMVAKVEMDSFAGGNGWCICCCIQLGISRTDFQTNGVLQHDL